MAAFVQLLPEVEPASARGLRTGAEQRDGRPDRFFLGRLEWVYAPHSKPKLAGPDVVLGLVGQDRSDYTLGSVREWACPDEPDVGRRHIA